MFEIIWNYLIIWLIFPKLFEFQVIWKPLFEPTSTKNIGLPSWESKLRTHINRGNQLRLSLSKARTLLSKGQVDCARISNWRSSNTLIFIEINPWLTWRNKTTKQNKNFKMLERYYSRFKVNKKSYQVSIEKFGDSNGCG